MPYVTLMIVIPLVGALAVLVVPRDRVDAWKGVAIVTAVATLAVGAIMLANFDRGEAGLQFVERQAWAEEVGLAWVVGVDGISIWLLMLTAALFLLAIVGAAWRTPERGAAFLMLLLLGEAGLMGLFAAGHLVLFYVFWEAMLIPFYFLIGVWGGPNRRPATLKFLIYTMFGSLLMLVALVATAFSAEDITGQFTFEIAELRGIPFSATTSTLLFLGFAIAFAIKLPLWPFHAWLPDAYVAAPILVTGLLAAVMSKAGVYGFLRIGLPVLPEGAKNLAVPLGILAVVGIIYGSLLAWRAPTMRLLVGYSSLAHLGFILLGIVAFDIQASQGAVLQMVNHGIVVAAAFAIVAIISRGTGGNEIVDDVGGLAAGAPRLAGVFLIVAMASLAIPGSNSFAGEFFILTGVFRHHAWLAALATIGIVYAAVYMLRLYQTSMNGAPHGADPRRAELRPVDYATLLPLLAAMLFIALWPGGLIGATTASLEDAIAPAQVAAGRPADQIDADVVANPPPEAVPLPGDEPDLPDDVPPDTPPGEGGAP